MREKNTPFPCGTVGFRLKGSNRSLSAILLFLAAMTAPALYSDEKKPVELIAHRGYSAVAPENTVAAFRLAWEKGTDACELDLYLSGDGRVVVIHDASTLRTAGVDLKVASTSTADLQSLDAGSWKSPAYVNERIPTLAQALETMPRDRGRFFLEIKCGPEVVPALKAVLDPMRERAGQLAVISFNQAAAAETKKMLPWVPVYLLSSGKSKGVPRNLDALIATALEAGLDGLDLGTDWPWTEEMVRRVRQAGLGLYVWTVNDPILARKLVALGVDGLTTDDPVALRTALEDGAIPSAGN